MAPVVSSRVHSPVLLRTVKSNREAAFHPFQISSFSKGLSHQKKFLFIPELKRIKGYDIAAVNCCGLSRLQDLLQAHGRVARRWQFKSEDSCYPTAQHSLLTMFCWRYIFCPCKGGESLLIRFLAHMFSSGVSLISSANPPPISTGRRHAL